VQHGSPQPVSSRHVVSKKLKAKRTAKSRPTRASNEAVSVAALRKQSMTSDDWGHLEVPLLEPSLAGGITLLSDCSHNVFSKALKAYDRLVLKESRNINANQQKIEEAQCQIKKSQ
jgi:hypothetical protein